MFGPRAGYPSVRTCFCPSVTRKSHTIAGTKCYGINVSFHALLTIIETHPRRLPCPNHPQAPRSSHFPPARTRPSSSTTEPTPAEARLTRALNGLNNAVTAQRAAMTAWKSALGDLRTVTGRLGDSLRNYNDSLGHLDARVKTLRTEAVKLEAWADDVLAKKG